MKILHTSDWHLGRRPVGGIGNFSEIRFNDYFESAKWIIEKALEEKVDLILISGDLFDKSSILPEVFDRTIEILQIAKENKIKIFAVEGNHDRVFQGYSWLKSLDKRGYLKLLENDEVHEFESYNFYGLPYIGFFVYEFFEEFLKKIKTKSNNILVVHTAIDSNNYFPGTINKELADRLGEKFDYVAGGHFHSYDFYPDKNPFFFVPGSPEYWDLYEKDEKGIIIYDTEKKEHTFIPSKKRKIHRLTLELKNKGEFLEKAKELIQKNSVNGEDILILNIRIFDTDNYINADELEKDLSESEEIEALKIIVKIDYDKNFIKGMDITKNRIEEIEKSVIVQEWNNIFSFNAEKTVKFTEELKNIVINEKNESELYEVTDKFLDSLLEGNDSVN